MLVFNRREEKPTIPDGMYDNLESGWRESYENGIMINRQSKHQFPYSPWLNPEWLLPWKDYPNVPENVHKKEFKP